MKYSYLSVIFVFFLFASACKKENSQPKIPEAYVNFFINPNSTEYLELNAPGGWVYVTGGYRGILLYRLTINEFLAYERTCPYDPEHSGARVEVEESEITCVCPVCNSKYILVDGSPFEGPSLWLMKQYRTTYDGTLLYVYN